MSWYLQEIVHIIITKMEWFVRRGMLYICGVCDEEKLVGNITSSFNWEYRVLSVGKDI